MNINTSLLLMDEALSNGDFHMVLGFLVAIVYEQPLDTKITIESDGDCSVYFSHPHQKNREITFNIVDEEDIPVIRPLLRELAYNIQAGFS